MRILKKNELQEVLDRETYREEREAYCIRKRSEGYEIFLPAENELAIDLDSEEALQIFKTKFQRFKEEDIWPGELSYKVYSSTSPLHYHVVVTLPGMELNNVERIALQAVLGSDLVRELLSLFRHYNNDPYPTLLAMKPGAFK